MGRFSRRAHGKATPADKTAGASVPAAGADSGPRAPAPDADSGASVPAAGADSGPAGQPEPRLSRRRLATIGAVAVLGVALHSHAPAGTPKPGEAANPAAPAHPATQQYPGPPAPNGSAAGADGGAASAPGAPAAGRHGAGARQASTFRQIILPDLLVIDPNGLTKEQTTRLRKITGVHNMITFDGASITAGGKKVGVIGVNPATFRSWVPLRTASDQRFWTYLSNGEFAASHSAARHMKLKAGGYYVLQGATAQTVRFGQSAKLGLPGIDLLVNQETSAKLGLVRQVAGLISAPGVSLARLTAKVKRVLGPEGNVVVLRSQLPLASAPAGRPASYLDLFKASAAEYCPGLSWTVLAAIGQIESGDGTNMGPSTAGALGPMQFLPSTWARWGIDAFGETGPPNVFDPYDAVPSAARMLCADGAAAGGQSLYNAIFDYNHAKWYVNEVLALAAEYAANYP